MSQDSILLNSTSGDSRLLSQSPILPSSSSLSSDTGPGGNDLSLSELSLSERVANGAPPSRFGPLPDPNSSTIRDPEELERNKKHTRKLRDEKLQNDAFILKKMNASLASFNDALSEVGSQNERVAVQLEQTEALLNKYVSILSGSEDFARLIFDDQWHGADADDMIIAQEQREAEESARKLREERAAVVQREKDRLEREEQARADQRGREQTEKDKKERLAVRGGVRGVRGTRASMRAARGSVRGDTLLIRVGPTSSGRISTTSASSEATSATRGSMARGLGRRT
ncbi:hypothetical protein C8R43DRAFT_1089701 [Mycena crocata]|nr:hypothetical protein C8R43DRAFT_1089701 [Mycena crocata]